MDIADRCGLHSETNVFSFKYNQLTRFQSGATYCGHKMPMSCDNQAWLKCVLQKRHCSHFKHVLHMFNMNSSLHSFQICFSCWGIPFKYVFRVEWFQYVQYEFFAAFLATIFFVLSDFNMFNMNSLLHFLQLYFSCWVISICSIWILCCISCNYIFRVEWFQYVLVLFGILVW